MTSDRAQAYGRVVKALGELYLRDDEKATVREAADALLFTEDLDSDEEARASLARLRELADDLVDGDRVAPEAAGSLLADVEDCGPLGAPVASA